MTEVFTPFDATIYVGSGHSKSVRCKNGAIPQYDKVRMRLETDRIGPLVLTVKACTACGAVFLPYPKYDKHWVHLRNYRFLRAKDGHMPLEEQIKNGCGNADPNYVPPKIDYDEVYKTPAYIQYALRHPFQGGSMSTK